MGLSIKFNIHGLSLNIEEGNQSPLMVGQVGADAAAL